MKLRIKGNSLRLRVTRPELATLAEGGQVAEVVRFGPGPRERLAYVLRVADLPAGAAVPAPSAGRTVWATLDGQEVRVTLAPAAMRRWREPDAVGVDGRQPVGTGEELYVLVEKDFACVDGPPGSEDPDAFRNPTAAGPADGRTC